MCGIGKVTPIKGNLGVLQVLLRHGASVDKEDDDGNTAGLFFGH